MKGDQVVEEANAWVSNATKGLINNVLPPGYLVDTEKTAFIVANALYFEGTWANGFKFDPLFATTGTFHLLNGKRISSVPFMTKPWPLDYLYDSSKGFKTVKINSV